MAVGVPEKEVFAAADAVLERGERPTVERVRLELGRGSPARVGALLDEWWALLAQRLSGEARLPELPPAVSQAFVGIWKQAIALAEGVAEQSLAEQRAVLAKERERLAEVEDSSRQSAATYRQQASEAVAARLAAEGRLADLELLLAERQHVIHDLQRQRDNVLGERDQALQRESILQEQLRSSHEKHEDERKAQETYTRGVEERAHQEVDRAREETKRHLAEVKSLGRQLEQLQQRLDEVQDELGKGKLREAALQGRADAMEAQLNQRTKARPSARPAKAPKAQGKAPGK